jgi:hypothetical protein
VVDDTSTAELRAIAPAYVGDIIHLERTTHTAGAENLRNSQWCATADGAVIMTMALSTEP